MTDNASKREWAGIYAAIPTFFTESGEIDDHSMNSFMEWLIEHKGIKGVIAHAHGGEVTNLTIGEQVHVSRSAVEAAAGRVRVVSGLMAEGIEPGVDMARRFEDVGVNGLLVMPPHNWMRHGKTAEESEGHVRGISERTTTSLIIHEYPATTLAGYSTDELVAFSKIDRVVAIKSGTRNMSRYTNHVTRLRAEAPHIAILTCHDEAMLPTLAPGVDGALVTLGSLIPDELAAMVAGIAANDLDETRRISDYIRPLTQVFYGSGDPVPRSHALLKAALHRLGVVPNMVVRPPIAPISKAEINAIDSAIEATGLGAWRR